MPFHRPTPSDDTDQPLAMLIFQPAMNGSLRGPLQPRQLGSELVLKLFDFPRVFLSDFSEAPSNDLAAEITSHRHPTP